MYPFQTTDRTAPLVGFRRRSFTDHKLKLLATVASIGIVVALASSGAVAQSVGGTGGGPDGGTGGGFKTTGNPGGGDSGGGGGGAGGALGGPGGSGQAGAGGTGGVNAYDGTGLGFPTNATFDADTAGPAGAGQDGTLAGGGGGSGGYGVVISGTGAFGTTATIAGGTGGDGGQAVLGNGYGTTGFGGFGGDGGVGLYGYGYGGGGGFSFVNNGTISGGTGGEGGYLDLSQLEETGYGNAGDGGVGGTGVLLTRAGSVLTNAAGRSIAGGHGGEGGYVGGGGEGELANAGNGGTGGIGINAASATISNQGLITGGLGGSGGVNDDAVAGLVGAGGDGIRATSTFIRNFGTVSGGNAGMNDDDEDDDRRARSAAVGTLAVLPIGEVAGGYGITGSDLVVVNGNTVSGGLSSDGVTRQDAVLFTGGTNILEIDPGGRFNGNVVAFVAGGNRNDTLVLGGAGVDSFNLSDLANGDPTAKFQDFGHYQKTGSSQWTLTGTTTLSGKFQVFDGTLVVDGSATNMTFAAGTGDIDPVIGGNGVIGALVLGGGGVVDPRVVNPNAMLTVTGAATFGPGSTLRARITPGGSTATELQVNGATTISTNNTTVDVVAAPGTYTIGQRYVLLTSGGGVTGRFSNLTYTNNLAFLQPFLIYDPNDVVLSFAANGVTFPSVAGTPNQQAAAGGIQSLGPGNPLFGIVQSQTPQGARQAFDATSGEPHASTATAGIADSHLVSGTIIDRLWNVGGNSSGDAYDVLQGMNTTLPTLLRCYAPGDTVTRDILSSYTVWGQAFGDFGRNGGNGNAAALDRSLGGFIVGADVPIYGQFADVWRVGVAGGYTNDSLTVADRSSSGTYESAFGSLYGALRAGPVDVRLGASVASNQTTLRRNVAFPGFLEQERSSYGGTTVQGFGEIGYRFTFGRKNLFEPVAGFTAVHLDQDGFREGGGIAALRGFGHDTDVQTTTLGFRAEAIPFPSLPLVARLYLAWQHGFGDLSPTAVVAFRAGGTPFEVSGAPIDRDAALAEVGFDYDVNSAMTVGLNYAGQIGERDHDNAVRGRLNYRF